MLSLELFKRFLLSRRAGSLVRTISRISIVGIWLGVTSLVIVVSVMNGFNRSIQKKLLDAEPHVVVMFDEASTYDDVVKHPLNIEFKDRSDVNTSIFATQDIIVRSPEGIVRGAVAREVSRETLTKLLKFAIERFGETDEAIEEKVKGLRSGDLVMGMGLARHLSVYEEDSVTLIPPENLLLAAGEIPVYSKGNVAGFLLTDIDRIDGKSIFYVIDQSFPRLRKSPSRQMGMELWLDEPQEADTWKAKLSKYGVKAETWKDRNASLFFALKVEKLVMALLVGLSTLIAGFSIVSVMVLLLTQKKKDIGNFLAMGMTIDQTKKLFVHLGMYLSLIGVLGGLITGVAGALAVDSLIPPDILPQVYEETNIPAEVRIPQLVYIVLVAVFFCFVALKITMRRLSNINPSEVLRG